MRKIERSPGFAEVGEVREEDIRDALLSSMKRPNWVQAYLANFLDNPQTIHADDPEAPALIRRCNVGDISACISAHNEKA